MNCQRLEADLVDLARGTVPDGEAASSVLRHLDGCAACAARFEVECRVTAGLRALGAATVVPTNDLAERRLMDAFASTRAVAPRSAWNLRVERWQAMAAAACLLFFVGAWAAVEWRGREAARTRSAAPAQAVIQAPQQEPLPVARVESPVPDPAPLATRTNRATAPRVVRAALRDEPPQDTDRLAGFIPLPAAGGLPGFDSGMIVRVALPTASLPAYGLALAPEATQTVNAELLVGQDGQARAIRLVSLAGGSRREPR